MVGIQAKLGGMPTVMHNRQWSAASDYVAAYAAGALPFEWLLGPKWAAPRDPIAFFGWFFEQQAGWGLSMYEQERM